jgi:ADP-ribose pyrophosphatase YjhB (NUDIX family)
MAEYNISIETLEGRFSYRVGGIIIDSNRILMVKNSGDSYYYTVGGRVKFGESAQEAVLREAFEETKIQFEIERLGFIHENFFIWEQEGNLPFHEIVLFFYLKTKNQLDKLENNIFNEEYGEVTLHWLPINDLDKINLFPEFFKTELKNNSNNIKHIVSMVKKREI